MRIYFRENLNIFLKVLNVLMQMKSRAINVTVMDIKYGAISMSFKYARKFTSSSTVS